jgi:23S rRNA (cytosine1962-C5)-methyltransferase
VQQVWTVNQSEPIDHVLIKPLAKKAIDYRMVSVKDTDAIRIVFCEADGFSGLVVD